MESKNEELEEKVCIWEENEKNTKQENGLLNIEKVALDENHKNEIEELKKQRGVFQTYCAETERNL